MSRPCRDCGEPIDWAKIGGRNVPVIPGTQNDHRETCAARQGQVPDRLKRPSAHHTAAYKLKKFRECQLQFFLEVVREEKGSESTRAQDSGKLEHAAVEYVTVERGKTQDFARPVEPDELLAALDVVVAREAWDAESLAHAREVLVRAAPQIDLSFVAVDEHGPLVERKFELPVGGGVIAGGVLDLVEFVGDVVLVRDWKGGQWRDPAPARNPAVGLYAEWASLLWPEREVRVVLQYIALDQQDEVAGPELAGARADAKTLARAVVSKARARGNDESAWPATFGGHCLRCPFTAQCATFKSRMGERPDGSDPETLEDVVAAIHRLAPVANIFERRVKDLRARAIALVAPHVNAQGRVLVAGYPVRIKTITRKGYEVKESTYQQVEVGDPDPALVAAITHELAHPTRTPEAEGARASSSTGNASEETHPERINLSKQPPAEAAHTTDLLEPSAEKPGADTTHALDLVEARQEMGRDPQPAVTSEASGGNSASPAPLPTAGAVGAPAADAPRPLDPVVPATTETAGAPGLEGAAAASSTPGPDASNPELTPPFGTSSTLCALDEDDEVRFRAHIAKVGECLEWIGARNELGYGIFRWRKLNARAHRLAWEMENGPIPNGLCVLHRCDNPPCVNTDHLFVGTKADNTADMVAKGRARGGVSIGSKNPGAKLTEAQVVEIRAKYATDPNKMKLGREYGVSDQAIRRIVTGTHWKSVTSPDGDSDDEAPKKARRERKVPAPAPEPARDGPTVSEGKEGYPW